VLAGVKAGLLVQRLPAPRSLTAHLEKAPRGHFSEAWASG